MSFRRENHPPTDSAPSLREERDRQRRTGSHRKDLRTQSPEVDHGKISDTSTYHVNACALYRNPLSGKTSVTLRGGLSTRYENRKWSAKLRPKTTSRQYGLRTVEIIPTVVQTLRLLLWVSVACSVSRITPLNVYPARSPSSDLPSW